jgi:hypothetical protein
VFPPKIGSARGSSDRASLAPRRGKKTPRLKEEEKEEEEEKRELNPISPNLGLSKEVVGLFLSLLGSAVCGDHEMRGALSSGVLFIFGDILARLSISSMCIHSTRHSRSLLFALPCGLCFLFAGNAAPVIVYQLLPQLLLGRDN